VIIFQVFSVQEGYKRSTTSGADAQVAGALGLYALEREMRMAGFGITDRVAQGCNMLAYTSSRVPTNYSLTLAPVQIHAGASANDPDIISINYGTPVEFGPGYGLIAANMAPGSNFRLENRGGIRFFDFLVAYQPSAASCSLVNAVNLPLAQDPTTGANAPVLCGGTNATDSVEICAGIAKTDSDGVARRYNQAGGLAGAPTYTVQPSIQNTRYYNLGPEPVFSVFRVLNGTLSVCNMRLSDCGSLAAANWVPVMENVVHMKAMYGIDTDGNGSADAYSTQICRETTGNNFGDAWTASSDTNGDGLHDTWSAGVPNGNDWSRVKSIRVAVVVRGTQFEKEDVTLAPLKLWDERLSVAGINRCANGAIPNEPATIAERTYTVPEAKYRYRVFETVIPLRNVLWLP
jgi:type IV pilus assembly protein PilW